MILLVLFAVSFIPAQIFAGLYGTALSPSFIGRYLNQFIQRLEDPETHRDTFGELIREIVRSQNIRVPPATYQLIVESGIEAMDTYWINVELARNADNVLAYLRGSADELDLSIRIGARKAAFQSRFRNGLTNEILEEMRTQLPRRQRDQVDEMMLRQYVVREVSDAIDDVPDIIDLDAGFDEATKNTITRGRKYFLLYSNLLVFLVPVVLVLPCLRLLKPTAAAPAVGIAMFATGASGLILTLTQRGTFSRMVQTGVVQTLPREFRWVAEIVRSAVDEFVQIVLSTAITVTVIGFVITAGGIVVAVLIRRAARQKTGA